MLLKYSIKIWWYEISTFWRPPLRVVYFPCNFSLTTFILMSNVWQITCWNAVWSFGFTFSLVVTVKCYEISQYNVHNGYFLWIFWSSVCLLGITEGCDALHEDLYQLQYSQLCLLTYPLIWKCASSENGKLLWFS